MDAANNRGGAVKKREDTHRMAEANRSFLALSLVSRFRESSFEWHARTPIERLPKYRHHGAHRCRQDDDHGACALLYWSFP